MYYKDLNTTLKYISVSRISNVISKCGIKMSEDFVTIEDAIESLQNGRNKFGNLKGKFTVEFEPESEGKLRMVEGFYAIVSLNFTWDSCCGNITEKE